MRNVDEVEEYKNSICSKGFSDEKTNFCIQAFEGCIPFQFWNTKKTDIQHNVAVFKKVILKYCKNINKALQKGYGLVLVGDNGVGKTIFLSYILIHAIKKGRSVYYTTLSQLDYNIKRGFGDKKIARYLNLMLTSDFVVIDEVGKEKVSKKRERTFMDSQFERIWKQRNGDNNPVLIGSNESYEKLSKLYGSSIESIISGKKCRIVQLEPGDYRKALDCDIKKDMGF